MGRVIQAFFVGGVARADSVRLHRGASHAPALGRAMPGPPAPAFGHAATVQQRAAPGRPGAPGGAAPLEIDPLRLGLASGRGAALPQPLLAKMEAAFGADFSSVRVHVGPQAGRIGALAFTTGNDLYFAPGKYQPDTMAGQQLIGHELAHVIQQRQGRARAAGSGVSIVQDRQLEAEADRLGMRAAAHRLPPIQCARVAPTHSVRAAAIQCVTKKKKQPGPDGNCAPTVTTKYTKANFTKIGKPATGKVYPHVRLALHATNKTKVAKAKAEALVIPVFKTDDMQRDDHLHFNASVENCENQMWEITKKINNGRMNAKQIGSNRAKQTEVIGEVAALRAMSARYPKYELAFPIVPGHGAGIDQMWVKHDVDPVTSTKTVSGYLIVEAKGPNQALSKGQMSPGWVRKKMESMANSKNGTAAAVARNVIAALNRTGGTGPSVRGRVVKARWDDEHGNLRYSISKPGTTKGRYKRKT